MALETEKIFTLLNKFLDEHGDEYQKEKEYYNGKFRENMAD